MQIINDELLNQVEEKAASSARLRMNYNLHEAHDSKSQRLINVLLPGTLFKIHRHVQTSASVFIIRGRVGVQFYDDSGKIRTEVILDARDGIYGVNIAKGEWHSLRVLDAAVVLEVKDGPYFPLEEKDILIENKY